MEVAGAAPAGNTGGQGGAPAAQSSSQTSTTAAPTGSVATSSSAGNNITQDWTNGFTPEFKDYVTTKGFKDPSSMVDSYRNLEKLMGVPKERLAKFPERMDQPSPELDAIYEKLGAPKDFKEYKIETPKELGGPEDTEFMQKMFAESKIPKAAGEAMAQKYYARLQQQVTQMKEQRAAQVQQQETTLKKEWGAAFQQNIEMAKRAVRAFGVPDKAIDALEQSMGFDGVMKFMHSLSAKIGEHSFVSGSQNSNQFGNALTPDQAKGRIDTLKKDADFIKNYSQGKAAAREEMERLHRMAYPDLD